MEKPRQNRIKEFYQPSRSLTEEEVRQYVEEAAEEAFRIENLLLDSPLDSDAVEGYASANYDFDKKKPFDGFDTFLQKMQAAPTAKRVTFNQRKTIWNRMAAVAAVALVVVAAVFLLRPSPPTNEQLFAQNYEFYSSGVPTFRGNAPKQSEGFDTDLNRAMLAYEKKDFDRSSSYFETVLESNSANVVAKFFGALTNLEIGEIDKAAALFSQVKNANKNFSEEASWYLILANLKKGDGEQAKILLEDYLKSGNNFNRDKALKLQKNL